MGLFHRTPQQSLAQATEAATLASHKRLEEQRVRSGRKNKPSVAESIRSRQSSTASSSSSVSNSKFPIETSFPRTSSGFISTPTSGTNSPSPERNETLRSQTSTPVSERPRISRSHTPIVISTPSTADKLPFLGTGATIAAGPGATLPKAPIRDSPLPPLSVPSDQRKRLPSISGLCMNPPTPDAESPTPTQTRFNDLPKTGLRSGPRPQRTGKASDEWREYREKRRSGWVGS